jgi:catechol 2,3-dioxygenase-like lactoylglutathione lyase family enzyme
MNLEFDHIGVVVDNLEEAIKTYSTFNYLSNIQTVIISDLPRYRVESQKVDLTFVKLADKSSLELIQADEGTPLYNLRQKGAAFYHIAYRLKDWDRDLKECELAGLVPIADAFESEAFGGKRCQFFKNNLGHLIEIVES